METELCRGFKSQLEQYLSIVQMFPDHIFRFLREYYTHCIRVVMPNVCGAVRRDRRQRQRVL